VVALGSERARVRVSQVVESTDAAVAGMWVRPLDPNEPLVLPRPAPMPASEVTPEAVPMPAATSESSPTPLPEVMAVIEPTPGPIALASIPGAEALIASEVARASEMAPALEPERSASGAAEGVPEAVPETIPSPAFSERVATLEASEAPASESDGEPGSDAPLDSVKDLPPAKALPAPGRRAGRKKRR